ncbi:hypothetical protein EJ06DRAFT_482381 [Trichodelitschia bisporula]|uniref:EDC4-like protein pdc1 beta-propeller domain-containing protein n=1 Tax=Trichodelitschia bisporula TaxID=703511 RepID=A0A6G1HMA2_9PEZI|nr:hypothetical protein EJ06DRAFT_482381 [Trichodelitschia bisporula]
MPKPIAKSTVFTSVNPFEQFPPVLSQQHTPAQDDLNRAHHEPTEQRDTVSEAVNELGERVDQELEHALTQLTSEANGSSEPGLASIDARLAESQDVQEQETHRDIETEKSQELTDVKTAGEESSGGDNWEEVVEKQPKQICVFSFQLKPFVSIRIEHLTEPPMEVQEDMISDIARVKKDFDQIDRSLVCASQNVIAYPLKGGGFRLIQQEDGNHRQIFSSSKERIFNLSLSSNIKGNETKDVEAVLGTGVNGSVFWVPLANFPHNDHYGPKDEDRGFIFPPVQTQDENTSGGQLKTRVKATFRNPAIFAYGRGKNIYIIHPQIARHTAYTDRQSRVCNSEKYIKEHSLKISTEKAGKDFCFSTDDSIMVSLDKAGRMRFWDIRELTAPTYHSTIEPWNAVEVKVPLMTLATSHPSEKSWPTSVMFLDKDKPMVKGVASRYVLVGMKQNHTLQLWDLGLKKPVQEIHFPHSHESDAICSIAYHARSGILAVGHPTRNSIYLLHVSAPKYTLPILSQAKYVSMLANNDAAVPAPASTVIVSNVREYSLGSKGVVRSLEIIDDPTAQSQYGDQTAPLFSIYVMHSKGLSELRITRSHLGWSAEGKLMNSVDALEAGSITMTELKPPPVIVDEPVAGESPPPFAPTVTGNKPAKDAKPKDEPASTRVTKGQVAEILAKTESPANGSEKPDKKKKKKGNDTALQVTPIIAPTPQQPSATMREEDTAKTVSPSPQRKLMTATNKADAEVPKWATQLLKKDSPSSGPSIAEMQQKIEKLLTTELEGLYRKLAADKRVQDATGASRQDAVLRLVSTTLTENVESSLQTIVTEGLEKLTTGPLRELIASSIDSNISDVIADSIEGSVPRELEKSLLQVMNDQRTITAIGDTVFMKVAHHVEAQLMASLPPAIANIALSSAKQIASDVDRMFVERHRQLDMARQQDNSKLDRLINSVSQLQEMLHAVAEEQTRFQVETRAALSQMQHSAQPPLANAPAQAPAQEYEKSPEELERDNIRALLSERNLEAATVTWIRSQSQTELFDELFSQFSPTYLGQMDSLVQLSVAAAVTSSLNTYIPQRIAWLEYIISLINPHNPDYADGILYKILEVIQIRVHQAYVQIAENNTHDPILRKVGPLAKRIKELKDESSST